MAVFKDPDTIVLSSGREVYVHSGFLGIDDTLMVSYGYDGTISMDPLYEGDEPYGGAWTPAEKAELADLMLTRWAQFKLQTGVLNSPIKTVLSEVHPAPSDESDVPRPLREELMRCAIGLSCSFYYLCAIYRQGRKDALSSSGL